jgi:hypothetical protein
MDDFQISIKFPLENVFGRNLRVLCCKGGGGSYHAPTPTPVPVTSDAATAENEEKKRLKKLKGMASTVLTKGLLEEPNVGANYLEQSRQDTLGY